MPIAIEVEWGAETPVSVPVTTVGGKIVNGGGRITGWSFLESTGAAAASLIITSGGNIIGAVGIGSGLSSTSHFGDLGITFAQDLTIVVSAGSIEGCVYVRIPG